MELLELSDSVLAIITDYFTLASLYALFCVCRRFRNMSHTASFWMERAGRLFHLDIVKISHPTLTVKTDTPAEKMRHRYLIMHHIAQTKIYRSMDRDIAPDLWKMLPCFSDEEFEPLARGLMETETFVDKYHMRSETTLEIELASRSTTLIVKSINKLLESGPTFIEMLDVINLPWVYRRKLRKVIRRKILAGEPRVETETSRALDNAIGCLSGIRRTGLTWVVIRSVNNCLSSLDTERCIVNPYEMLCIIKVFDMVRRLSCSFTLNWNKLEIWARVSHEIHCYPNTMHGLMKDYRKSVVEEFRDIFTNRH